MPLLISEIELIKSKNPAVIKLSFADRAFTDADVLVLVSLLNDNPYIEAIDLGKNNIGDEGAKLLAGLKYVKSLDLSYNNVNEGAIFLVGNPTLQDLCLNCNNVQTTTLRRVLRQNLKHLHTLSLSNNPLSKTMITLVEQKIAKDRVAVGAVQDVEEGRPTTGISCCML